MLSEFRWLGRGPTAASELFIILFVVLLTSEAAPVCFASQNPVAELVVLRAGQLCLLWQLMVTVLLEEDVC